MQELEKTLLKETEKLVNMHYEDDSVKTIILRNLRDIRKHMSGKDTGVHTNDGWIPVEERLPMRTFDEKINESYQKYLVFIDGVDGWDIDIAVYNFWNDKKWREAHDGYGEIENVIAWRPLPEPYSPERNGE